jgi:tetratricopeptide (TPR) repeat protein
MDVRRLATGLACVSLLVVLLAPAAAHAVDPVEKVTQLNKKALDQYKRRDYDTARALLKEALELCNSSNLENHPIKARTHIHLGIVSIVGFKERDVGIRHFQKALEIQPDIKLTKSLSNRDLESAFEEAALSAGGGSGGGGPAGGGDEGGAGAGQGGGGPTPQASEDDEGAPKRPVRPKRPPPKKKKVADEDEEGGAKDKGEDEDEDEGDAPRYRLYIAVAVGTGVGVASGTGALDPGHKLSSAGFALAQAFQLSPEIGFFLKPGLMLSLRGRYQIITGLNGKPENPDLNRCGPDNYCSPGAAVAAGFVRLSIFFGGERFRIFVAPEVGGGYISHAAVFPGDRNCTASPSSTTMLQCVDTLNGGPVLVGAGFGFLFDVSRVFGLTVNVVADAGFPTFTFNFDFQGGAALHF